MGKLRKGRIRIDNNQIILQGMALVGVIWYIIFRYLPMYGLLIAFQEFSFRKGVFGSTFIGWRYFEELFTDPDLPHVLANTLIIAVLKLLVCFPITILFAVMLNEISSNKFKRFIQTVSYFPHFISWIIVSLIMIYFFAPRYGMVNAVFKSLGIIEQDMNILSNPKTFYGLAVLSELWKDTGWSAIIFLAAIAGIDPNVYEAAVVDGASKFQRVIHITIPSITGTIVLMFLMRFAHLFTGGAGTFEQSMFLGNALNRETSLVLGTYTMEIGIQMGRFSYATAVGFVNSTVSLILLLFSNSLCKKLFNRSLYVTEGG